MSNKYAKQIIGLDGTKASVDVYRVLDAFNVTCPAMAHAIKKALCPGQRGAKSCEKDKKEAIASIEQSILLDGQRDSKSEPAPKNKTFSVGDKVLIDGVSGVCEITFVDAKSWRVSAKNIFSGIKFNYIQTNNLTHTKGDK